MDKTLIEAALFSAGKPISAEEIAQEAGLNEDEVRGSLKKLISEYAKRETALEIAKVGSKFTMQLKPDMLPKAGKIAPTTIPKPVLKTAALIAYHQPIKQSKLLAMAGAKIYDHVKYLSDIGLISTKKYQHTFILTTSKKFPEYFGIPTARREDIKRWIAEKVGIKISKKPIVKTIEEKKIEAAVGESEEKNEENPAEQPTTR